VAEFKQQYFEFTNPTVPKLGSCEDTHLEVLK
jgi:hypothetical protein